MSQEIPASQPSPTSPILDAPLMPPTIKWGIPTAIGFWFATLVIGAVVPFITIFIYALIFNRQLFWDFLYQRLSAPILVTVLVGTFISQICTLGLGWVIVTDRGNQSFLETLGWRWSRNFRLPHAFGLAVLMMLAGAAIEHFLPNRETSMEMFLHYGMPVKIALAVVATMGAPIVEEVTYRGILYAALDRAKGKWLALPIVTLLFWGVHVAQYKESIATLVAMMVLSLVLTSLRTWTGQLLPCVIVHTIFNGIQSVALIFSDPKPAPESIPQPALQLFFELFRLLGIG